MARSGWSCIVDKEKKEEHNKGLKPMVSNAFQAHPTKKTVKGHTKNALLNMDVIKKKEEHTI